MGWRIGAYRAVRPLLFLADPELVHHLTLRMLGTSGRHAPWLCRFVSGAPKGRAEPVEIMGLRFRNRIGLAAGFDKDGLAIEGWAALGFGFVELGTVTPRPQPGNPRPRLFRLPHDEALINRMGFNNAGADALSRRIAAARPHLPPGFMVGVNLGRNRDTPNSDAVADYVAAARAVAEVADYLAVNVSSPNTPGLRELQSADLIAEIVEAVAATASRPVVVKLSPDMPFQDRRHLSERLSGAGVAGLIVSNTTVTRPGLRSRRLAGEPGGLSGRPLRRWTLTAVERMERRSPTIASGGVASGADAAALLKAGADLVQLWTGMIYAGPGLIGEAIAAASAVRERTGGWRGPC
jgi:dihydroorotate dehydrogenase